MIRPNVDVSRCCSNKKKRKEGAKRKTLSADFHAEMSRNLYSVACASEDRSVEALEDRVHDARSGLHVDGLLRDTLVIHLVEGECLWRLRAVPISTGRQQCARAGIRVHGNDLLTAIGCLLTVERSAPHANADCLRLAHRTVGSHEKESTSGASSSTVALFTARK